MWLFKGHLVRKLPRIIEIEGFFYNGKITVDKSVIKSKDKYKSEWELSQLVKKMYEDGNSYKAIEKIFNLQYRIIKKYLIVSKEELENRKSKISSEERVKRKQNLINKVRELCEKVMSKRAIANECNIVFKTVNSYLNENMSPKTKVSRTKNKDLNKFHFWLKNAAELNIRGLNSFIGGIKRDKEAVQCYNS